MWKWRQDFRKRIAVFQATQPDRCWIWEGTRVDGYGTAHFEGKQWKVHRLAYTLIVGPIPKGMHIDHCCPGEPNRACFNPSHLEPVTQGENNRRKAARRTHCRHGHKWTPENTIMVRVRHGLARWCRECGRLRTLAYMRGKHGYKTERPRWVNADGSERTHCQRGHAIAENMYVRPDGRRECKACIRARGQRYAEERQRDREPRSPAARRECGHPFAAGA